MQALQISRIERGREEKRMKKAVLCTTKGETKKKICQTVEEVGKSQSIRNDTVEGEIVFRNTDSRNG